MLSKRNILLLMMLYCGAVRGQLSLPYTLGAIGNINQVSTQINYTYFNDGKCLILESGLAVMGQKKVTGKFKGSCEETGPDFNSCPLTASPNPASQYATLRTKGCYDTYAWQKGSLRIVNTMGQVIEKREILMQDLRSGIRVEVSAWSAGVYYINVVFGMSQKTIKLIKAYEK